MSAPTATRSATASAHSTRPDARAAAADLLRQFGGVEPLAVAFFCAPGYDGVALSAALRQAHPACEVIGCTTAGEFTEAGGGHGGVSAFAFGPEVVARCAGALAEFSGGIKEGIARATAEIGEALGQDLRHADPERTVGIVLIDGLGGAEEEANHALGVAAPALSFVGGSAGDDLVLDRTEVFYNGLATKSGAALLVLETTGPFAVLKTQSVEPTPHTFSVTRADPARRTVYEVDGRPVLEAYAEATGVPPEAFGFETFMRYPWALMEGDQPWLRSPKAVTEDGGLEFLCEIEEGRRLQLMRQAEMLGPTRAALAEARRQLGGEVQGSLVFNCVYRRLELDALDLHEEYLALFAFAPMAGFHTYGESYLGHMNQTCVGLLLG
jgi:hypothetical protein